MTLQTVELQTGPHPQASVIVLHGLGADGHDFVPVMEALDLSAVGDVRFIFPHAPVRPITAFGGQAVRAWFDVIAMGGRAAEDEAGLRASQAEVETLLAHERERGIAPQRMVLAGFSQGCGMTLQTGLRHAHRLAGLVALSGWLPLAAQTSAERHAANADVPIFMAHGTQDPMIDMERAVASRDALAALGYGVEWHEYVMPHSVSPQEIVDLNRFLLAVLALG